VKDESAEEKGLGKVIAGKLREQLRADGAECPDAGTLACYYDHVLTETEREACEAHIVACARCQEQIAELARMSDADEAPVLVTDAPVTEEEPETGWGFSLAWVGLALVIVVSVGVWQRARIVSLFQPESETAENLAPPAPATPAAAPAGKRAMGAGQTNKREEARTSAALREKDAGAPAAVAENRAAPQPAAQIAADQALMKEAAGSAGPGAMATPAERRSLGAVVQPGGREIEMQVEKPNLQISDHDAVPAPAASARLQASSAPAKAAALSDRFGAVAGGSSISVQGSVPQVTSKWRVGRRGLIQKADPNGNWATVASGVTSDLFDITFAGSAAGWAVGHAGLVLRSTDGGETWARTSSPSAEDLVHVSATSALAARVITRSNKLFSTADGGETWTALSPE